MFAALRLSVNSVAAYSFQVLEIVPNHGIIDIIIVVLQLFLSWHDMVPCVIKNKADKNRTDIRAISVTNPLFGCQK